MMSDEQYKAIERDITKQLSALQWADRMTVLTFLVKGELAKAPRRATATDFAIALVVSGVPS